MLFVKSIWRLSMTVKDILDNLDPKAKQLLMYAFEHEFSQYITLPGNTFIGVNVDPIKHLEIQSKAGAWSIGKVKGI